MTTDLVPFIAKRWRDAIVAVTLIAFAAGGFVARAVIGFDPILSLCLAFAVGLIADLAAGSVAGAFAQECVTRDELRRRLDAEASPSFAQNATIIGGCASAAFLVLGLWKYPPQDLAILLFLIVAAVSGGGVFGFYCALAMRQVERWAASEARRPARRRLHLTVFETISFFLFFWSTSIAAGLGVSGLFDARDKASAGLLAGYLLGGGLGLRILRFTARIQAERVEAGEPQTNALNAFTMTVMVGFWVSTLVVLSASIQNPSMPWDLLAALFAIAFAAPSALGLAMWFSFQGREQT